MIVLAFDFGVQRKINFKLKRRAIPNSVKLFRYTPLLKVMYYVSVVVNSFAMVFNDSFLEYDLRSLYGIFIPDINE